MRIYEKHYRSISAPKGESTQLELGFFSEGFIKKIIVKQVGGGALVNFTVDIFNSKKAFADGSSSGGDEVGGDYVADQELYRVFPQASGASGEYLTISDDYGKAYKNYDGPLSDRKRKIYIQIHPSGTGSATWDIALSGWSDVG
jgi:hypothetical protein